MKKLVKKLLSKEFSKKWIDRFSWVVLIELLFSIPLCISLIILNIKIGLSTSFAKVIWENYMSFSKILVTGYAIVFVGYMTKAYFGKKEEVKNMQINVEDVNVQDDESDGDLG